MDVAAEDVGDVDTLGGVLADDGLTLLLVGGVDLVAMHAQEGLVVQLEHDLVGLELVEAHAFVLDHVEDRPGAWRRW